ncbi:zinc fingers and homeoboxes protein 2-like [Alosa sapidissima]|uniref:zinc fingers and homeoboxes protein 2-like n=1 Tax=Alosa sapidissima TaxID=34773 RepID=UPI001C09C2F0|nr:zinc fingers and homeoboxes protein 2-like [Alosa sapidissima]XP_041932796.1 zinc fingers and homeoboxes protein 2-like [Alosa sapidissima]XP_041932798.1 zinc fingers and homeoboxes protein 2-like [Alosa sapidissima]
MSSRRKSSTPCMIRVSDTIEEAGATEIEEAPTDDLVECTSSQREDWRRPTSTPLEEQSIQPQEKETVEEEEVEEEEELLREPAQKPQQKQHGGYECKYCPFSTQNLSDFKEHVDTTHPNVILNPLYLCAVCNFSTKKFDSLTEHNETYHPGQSNFKFKRIKLNNQTVLEQTIEGVHNSVDLDNEDTETASGVPDFTLSKSTTVKAAKPKAEEKHIFGQGNELQKHLENLMSKDQITAVNVNGTVLIPDPTILQGLSHVMPLLQRPPNLNSVPKIAVPLNTTKYNPLLDNNAILITSFNKFPYPTHAELSWLTAASKHPEEQIKVWFTTQRLKQGITWSPEEVEEARKKMFNGSMPPVHHTFTVLPDSFREQARSIQSLAQTASGSALRHSGQMLTTTANRTSLTSASVTVTTVSHVQSLKRPLAAPSLPAEVKRAMLPPADDPKEKLPMAPPPPPPKERLPMAPPPVPPEIKRPLSSLFFVPEIKRSMVAPIVSLKGKPPVALPLVASKERLPMPPPLMLPKERLTMSPAFSMEIKRSVVAPQIKNHTPSLPVIPKDKFLPSTFLPSDVKLPMAPPLAVPQMKRPTIIQTARGPSKTLPLAPTFSLESRLPKEQPAEPKGESRHSDIKEANGVSRGEVKSWLRDQGCLNGSLHMKNDLVPKERPKPVPTQFPLLERVKGKTTEQLKIMEESFQRNSFPSHGEVESLATVTRLSREEIDSWFLERRALRDNLEQALLNSMGAKRLDALEKRQQQQQQQKQNAALNGAHKPGGPPMSPLRPIIAPLSSPLHLDGKSLGLLKDVFVQTQWPSPEEYNMLESQIGLARTDIVRWFKDSRSELRNGTLDWPELSHKSHSSGPNGQGLPLTADRSGSKVIQRCQEAKITVLDDTPGLRDCAKFNSQEIKEWFANTLGHSMPDLGRNGGQNGGGRGDCGSWVQDPMRRNAGGVTQELVSDTD